MRKVNVREERTYFENRNLDFVSECGLRHGLLGVSETSIGKGISDATVRFREFLGAVFALDYGRLRKGDDPVYLPAMLVDQAENMQPVFASAYITKRGDHRLGLTARLKEICNADDLLLFIWRGGYLWVFNASTTDLRTSTVLAGFRSSVSQVPDLRRALMSLVVEVRTGAPFDMEQNAPLVRLSQVIESILPAGLKVLAGAVHTHDASQPWIGILDPDAASDTGDGLFLLWTFDMTTDRVVFGVAHSKAVDERTWSSAARAGFGVVLDQFRRNVGSDRVWAAAAEPPKTLAGLGGKPATYVAAIQYAIDDMPSEEELRSDLAGMIRLYRSASVNAAMAPTGDVPTDGGRVGASDLHDRAVVWEFRPSNREDYVVQMVARSALRQGSRHELLLTQYAAYASQRGMRASNTGVHPRDLVLQAVDNEWLIEAKVVYNGDARQAVRAAISQLLEYSHFFYDSNSAPSRMALFTESVGDAYVGLLDSLGIAAVWKGEGAWEGSALAIEAQLI